MQKSTINKLVLAAYGCLITYLLLASLGNVTDLVFPHADKLAHFLTYSVFTVLAYRAVSYGRAFMVLCVAIAAHSGLMEWAQSLNPDRMTSAADFLANLLGVVVAFLLLKHNRKFRDLVAADPAQVEMKV